MVKKIHDKILKELQELCDKYPEQRFGQILFNYTMIGNRQGIGLVQDPFHYNDEDFLDNIGN